MHNSDHFLLNFLLNLPLDSKAEILGKSDVHQTIR